MNDPEPPLLNRTDESCMWFRKGSVVSKPYRFFTASLGNWLTGHIPSSAKHANPASATKKNSKLLRFSILHTIVTGHPGKAPKIFANPHKPLYTQNLTANWLCFAFFAVTSLCNTK